MDAVPEEPAHDLNGDGVVSVADAVLLALFMTEDTELSDTQITGIVRANPDQNGDTLITILDICALLKIIVSQGIY